MSDPSPYRVSQPAAVTELLWRVLYLARDQGRGPSAAAALGWIQGELERTPHEFGEGRYADVPADGLMFRMAFVRPLGVEFAFDADARQVFG